MKHLKHLFTALMLVCCIGTAKAEEVTINGIKYDVVTKGKVATVISGGYYSGDIVIPSEITHNNVVCSVTSIGDNAFSYCDGLTSIEIPNSVTSIGNYAFAGCYGLTAVHISDLAAWCSIDFDDVNANPLYYAKNLYLNGEKLTELTIPDGIVEIKNYAFRNCTGLTSITIPNSVTSIGGSAFYGCSGLANVVIGNSVTSIGYSAFEGCSELANVVIGNSVTSIGNSAFYNCSGLANVVIGNSVTSIGNHAFYQCSGLTSVEIPNSVTSIGSYAFHYCTGLTSIIIPNSVTSIGNEAFRYCSRLKTVINFSNLSFSKGSSKNGYIAYYADKIYNLPGGFIENDFLLGIVNSVNTLVEYLGNDTVPTLPADYKGENYVINTDAFKGNTTITNIVIPNSVTSIGSYAFYNCTGLTNVVIGNGVTSIGDYTFYGCTGLISVTTGTGVKNIRSKAFAKCSNLTDVYCLATSVPVAKSDAFNESYPEYMTLHVPAEAIDSYKATAPWSSFGTIVTLDGDVTETPKCTTPTVLYSDGKLHFECETEGAEFVTEITSSDFNKFYNNDINLTATYNISVYATATGYENSDIVNATLCWVECECEGDDTGIINIPAKAVLVTSSNGVLHINCSLDGESVAVYTTAGTLIATTTIENGTATVATGLSKGSVAIVNIAGKSIKVAVN